MRHLFVRSFALAAGLLLAGSAANAATIGQLELGMAVGATSWSTTATGTSTGEYTYSVADGAYNGQGVTLTWSGVNFDIDPGVSGNWSVTNNSGVPQVMSLSVSVPVLPVGPSSLMFGSSSITVSDADFSGSASLTSLAPSPLYAGLIDFSGVPATYLFTDPYTLTATAGGTTGDTQSFGIFPGSVPGPAVAGSIGILHTFILSAGDRATFNSTFYLVPVPEPGTLMLAVSGLLGLGIVGRRRSA